MLAGYWTDIDRTCGVEYTVPEDNRVMVSVHYYSPADFAIADAATTWGYRKNWGTEADLEYLKVSQKQLWNMAAFDAIGKTFGDNRAGAFGMSSL